MKLSFLEKLACPFDKNELQISIHQQSNDNILEGILTCDQCHRYYPIIQGIPIMSPDEYREVHLEKPVLERWGYTIVLEQGRPTLQEALPTPS